MGDAEGLRRFIKHSLTPRSPGQSGTRLGASRRKALEFPGGPDPDYTISYYYYAMLCYAMLYYHTICGSLVISKGPFCLPRPGNSAATACGGTRDGAKAAPARTGIPSASVETQKTPPLGSPPHFLQDPGCRMRGHGAEDAREQHGAARRLREELRQ